MPFRALMVRKHASSGNPRVEGHTGIYTSYDRMETTGEWGNEFSIQGGHLGDGERARPSVVIKP